MRTIIQAWRQSPDPPQDDAAAVAAARRLTMRLSVREGGLWAVMTGAGDMFFPPFAVFLNAGAWAMSFLTTLPIIAGALAQWLAIGLLDRVGHRRRLIVPFLFLQGLMYLPLFYVPLAWPALGAAPVVIFAVAAAFCGNITTPPWLSMMGDVIPAETRGIYFGRRWGLLMLVVMMALVLGGLWLAGCKHLGWVWLGFGGLFTVAGVSRMSATALILRHYDPPYRSNPEADFSLLDFLRRAPRSNYARFVFFVALTNGASSVSAPFFSVYMLRDMQWSYAQFMANTAVLLGSQFLFMHWWGRVSDRHGNRVVLATTALVLPILPIVWAFSTNYTLLILLQVVSGAVWSGFNLATQNFILDAVTPPKRARATAYYNMINGVAVVLGGSLIGVWLTYHLPSALHLGSWHIRWLSSLPAVFIASGLIRIGVLFLLPTFSEVREVVPTTSGALFRRLWTGEAITDNLTRLAERVTTSLGQRD